MSRPTGWPLATALLAVAVTVGGCSTVPDDATGPEIFARSCARCHGSQLEGGVGPALGPGSNAADSSDEYLTTTIGRGQGRMPSFGGSLTEEQILSVVGFLREKQAG